MAYIDPITNPGVLDVPTLDRYLNPCGWPTFESVARPWPDFNPLWPTGTGVVAAFDAIHDRVLATVSDTPERSLKLACNISLLNK